MALLVALLLDLAAAAPSPLSAEPLRGPFPSLAAACAALRHDFRPPLEPAQCSTARDDACGSLPRARHIGPFAALQFVRVVHDCWLAVRAERGWYVGDTSLGFSDRHDSKVDAIDGEAGLVAVHTANYYWWIDYDARDQPSWYDLRRGVLVCGMTDGAPACTRELVLAWSPRWEDESGEERPHRWRWRYEASLAQGALVVRARSDDPRVPVGLLRLRPTRPVAGRYAVF